jgi:putative endonuclease
VSKQFYVYIVSNYLNSVLYTGITNNICKRVWEHKQELVSGFTKTYHVHNLVYFEIFSDPLSAIEREKQIKGWSRKKKNILILKKNPELKDLYPDLCK